MDVIPLFFIDILDIILVSVIFYFILVFFRGTKAISMIIGILIVFILGFISNMLQLRALSWLLKGLETVWLIAFVIVFQPEIRAVLTSLGKNPHLHFLRTERSSELEMVKEIVEACQWLADNYIGALIVIERNVGLRDILREDGIPLDAAVSAPLLETIFWKGSPLHDGAVIIKETRVVAAKARLPWTNRYLGRESSLLGMRHRAAMGIAEETDAFTIVVSEQRGEISIAVGKKLLRKIDADTLHANLSIALGLESKGNNWTEELKKIWSKT
ncbi:MAG: hypothetical protein APR63_08670 [Desulfuromonas sp. SDB]|nr:MAG: hypothetical protein APR63_08670 [Desulfuromonas sp. SDB]